METDAAEQNVGDIRGGMDVFALGGERLGIVTDVLLSGTDATTPSIGETVSVPLPPDAADVVETESASIAPTRASTSYFTVEGDEGVFFIPFDAVSSLFPGQNVSIECTRQEADSLYRRRPR